MTLLWLIRHNPGMSLRELAAEERISAPPSPATSTGSRRPACSSASATRATGVASACAHDEGEKLLKRVRARRTTWLADRLRGLDDDELEALERAIEPLGKLL